MEEGIVVAPGKGKKPVSILNDKLFPHLFPTGQNGYKIPLTPSKYFNQRLSHYTQKFASDNVIYFLHTLFYRKFNLAVRFT